MIDETKLTPAEKLALSGLRKRGWMTVEELGKGGGGRVYWCTKGEVFHAVRAILDDIRDREVSKAELKYGSLLKTLIEAQSTGDANVGAAKIPHLLAKDDAETVNRLARLRREIETMNKVQHPHLIKLLDAEPGENPRWFVMECHSSRTIHDRQPEYKGRPAVVLNAIRGMVEATSLLQGMSHAALKIDGGPPRNEIIGLDFQERRNRRHGKGSHETQWEGSGFIWGGTARGSQRGGLGKILGRTRRALRELVIGCGLEVFQEILEEDREALCGPRYQPNENREACRHGHDTGPLVFGGRKIILPKPCVRSLTGQEVPLPRWEQIRSEDPSQGRVAEQILLGVSTRKYAKSLEPLPDAFDSEGVSRSSVSRHFAARRQKEVEKFFARSLSGVDLPIIMVDGIHIDDHVLVVALGIDTSGKKQVWGLAEGSTENEEVCTNLFRSLIERGLVVDRARLFVIDGGKGIRKAIRATFGSWAYLQRCRVHEMRKVLGCLPEDRQASVRTAIHGAWNEPTVEKARGKLKALAARLKAEHPSAASSLLEGIDETLTILTLEVPDALAKILSSTNAIENLLGTLRDISRNVKRWRGGGMAVRWAATAFIAAEKKFGRIRGHREIPALMSALDCLPDKAAIDNKTKVA